MGWWRAAVGVLELLVCTTCDCIPHFHLSAGSVRCTGLHQYIFSSELLFDNMRRLICLIWLDARLLCGYVLRKPEDVSTHFALAAKAFSSLPTRHSSNWIQKLKGKQGYWRAVFVKHPINLSNSASYGSWIFVGFDQSALPFAVLGQILHTDVVYLHSGQGFREAEKIKRLLLQHKYAKEISICYSFLPSVMKIFVLQIPAVGWSKNSNDLTGFNSSFARFRVYYSFRLCSRFCVLYAASVQPGAAAVTACYERAPGKLKPCVQDRN